MSWSPKERLLDYRHIAKNILSFIATNQGDALKWANEGNPMKGFVTLSQSVANRSKPIYPSLSVVSESFTDKSTGDLIEIDYLLRVEGGVTGKDADALPVEAKKYAMAVLSMMVNVDVEMIAAGANGYLNFTVSDKDLDVPEIRANQNNTEFLQKFTAQVLYQLRS